MEIPESTTLLDFVERVRAWIPRRADPSKISRDFWMPDHSCRVCYECDSQFTLFIRRHHCRICGRVFCRKCTQNTIPVPSDGRSSGEEGERIRVCNFCYRICNEEIITPSSSSLSATSLSQWNGNGNGDEAQLANSSSSHSGTSGKSSSHSGNSSTNISSTMPYPTGPYQHISSSPRVKTHQMEDAFKLETEQGVPHIQSNGRVVSSIEGGASSPSLFAYCVSRSDDERDEYGKDIEDTQQSVLKDSQEYFGNDGSIDLDRGYILHGIHADNSLSPQNSTDHSVYHKGLSQNENYGKNLSGKNLSFQSDTLVERQMSGRSERSGEESEDTENVNDCNDDSAMFQSQSSEIEQPFDFENNGAIWVPPEPVDADDEIESSMLDDDDDDDEGGWGLPRSSGSFSSNEYKSKDRSIEEHRDAMRSVVDGHFRALVAQLLKGEEVFVGEENDVESWLEIVTSLSWQAATFVKPDTSKGGGMDPGLYVKVKCVASGRRSESKVVKGVVCSKNVKHKRMTQRYKNPRLLLLAGALEYQRISNQLSSLDTLLQQEMDHLKMTVSRIEAHHPNVLLVEKTVSHHAQEYLLTKEISLVLNVKKPLLERIARCTGAQIVPSLDNLAAPKVGHCELFHVEKFIEEHGSAGQTGRRQSKTLMFFEGCPKRLGCTVLLMGSNRDELKKIKHVLQYTVFAAYHLALETSFLADEGATLPELPLKSPITVALPDKQPSLDRSISIIPGFAIPVPEQIFSGELQTLKIDNSTPNLSLLPGNSPILDNEGNGSSGSLLQLTSKSSSLCNGPVQTKVGFRTSSEESTYAESTREKQDVCSLGQRLSLLSTPLGNVSGLSASLRATLDEKVAPIDSDVFGKTTTDFEIKEAKFSNSVNGFVSSVASIACLDYQMTAEEPSLKMAKENQEIAENEMNSKKFADKNAEYRNQEQVLSKEDFPPSPSDHQSILVLLSSRCVLKGTVCERSQLFRIKYYGSFDKPLGRYLRDDLFDQNPRCRFCNEPSEAHVLCYTHRQGSLTISVKRVPLLLTLPGEREGKIWMWHRCLKCARKDGVPEATRRVVMSDAAWGLSFGKFLELSFSNHAAASRVASCGHSLHRDCLRFYGFGSMIACFRYSSINVLSVYLPPSKLEFNDPNQQEWLRKEAAEVADKVELFYAEVFDLLRQIGQKIASSGSLYTGTKVSELRRQIAELEGLLQTQKAAIEEMLQRAIPSDWQPGKPVADVLELNRLRRYLLCLSYSWDRHLWDLDLSLTTKDVRTGSSSPENVRTPLKDSSSFKELAESQITCNTGGLGSPGIENLDSKIDGNNLDKANISRNPHTTVIPSGDGNAICDGLVQPAMPNDFNKPFDNKLKETCSMNGKLDDGVKTFEVAANRVTPDVNDMESPDHSTRDLSTIAKGMFDNLDVENGECCTDAKVSEMMSVETVASRYSQDDLDGDHGTHSVFAEGHFQVLADLSDTLDAAWTGEGQSASVQAMLVKSQVLDIGPVNGSVVAGGGEPAVRKDFQSSQQTAAGGKTMSDSVLNGQDKSGMEVSDTSTPTSPVKLLSQSEDFGSWIGAPLSNLSKRHTRSFQGTVSGSIRLDSLLGYSPKFVSLFSNLGSHGGGRLVLPSGVNNTVIAVYDDEPTSIISYALSSHEYQVSLHDNGPDNEKQKEKDRDKEKEYAELLGMPVVISYPISSSDSSSDLVDFLSKERGSGSEDLYSYSLKGSGSGISDLSRPVHVKVSFTDEGLPVKTKYTVTCYFAREFDALRRKCCPTEMDFRLSLSRCKKWGAQGGKSNVFFAKSLDDRFVIKQVTRTELDSFIKFAPEYFKYLTDSLSSGSPTCLAKILGIYQVIMKHAKGGREIRMDLMVMENLLFGRNVTRVYDLKGSGRSRYNSDSTGSNKVLLDQNLLEAMPTAPIFLGNKAKRLLERAVWNDTSFLASIDVMDYSLLVGVDEERCELVLGIIDFMRQYTWDKHLETWVKASGILGGPKNTSPTVISPKQYKKRFRKAMSHYFLMVPDQWYPPAFIPSPSQTDVTESGSSFLTRDDGGDQLV